MTRRAALQVLATAAGGSLLGCSLDTTGPPNTVPLGGGRIRVRPTGTNFLASASGTFDLIRNTDGDSGRVFVPTTYKHTSPAPMVILFHGAQQRATDIITPLSAVAEELGIILVATNSRSNSWDVIEFGTYNSDVNYVNFVLPSLFNKYNVDATRIGMAGFSDGASYALSLALGNGDLISRVVAFSPSGIANGALPVGKPSVFITHGKSDTTFPITLSRNNIMPYLQTNGYPAQLHEFEGGHQIPVVLAREGMQWLTVR